MFFKLCILLIFLTVVCKGDHLCHKVKKEYGHVCLCNAHHCDTISAPKKLSKNQFHLYSTSDSRPGFNHDIGYFRLEPSTYKDITIIEVHENKRNQTLRGFGGAFTDSFGYNLKLLPKKVQNKLIRSYFSEDGIEYTTCRVVLGSCDFSLREYTYLPKHDPSMKSFHLTKDDHIYKIAVMKKAVKMSKRKIKFLGSSWSSPKWIHVTNKTRINYVKDEFKQLWADYHVKALQEFKKAGLDFWGLTTGNEGISMYLLKNFLANMTGVVMFPEEQRDWVHLNLGPSIRKSGLKTSIFLLDDMRYYTKWWVDTVMRNHQKRHADQSVSGVALHWYGDLLSPPEIYDDVKARYPHIELIYTETSFNGAMQTNLNMNRIRSSFDKDEVTPSKPFIGSWERAGMYASNIIENLNHWVTTYMDWNLALDTKGGPNSISFPCDAAILINTTNHEFYKQPIFYVMGHFSKFIPPGSVVIKLENITEEYTNEPQAKKFTNEETLQAKKLIPYPFHIKQDFNLKYVGTLDPKGRKSHVLYNPKPTPVEVVVRDSKNGYAHLFLDAHSINTLVYW